jgi:hypothetical protein
MIRQINPYFAQFRQMNQMLREAEERAEAEGVEFVEPRMYLVHRPDEARGRYNDPVSAADMAVVFTGDEGLPPAPSCLRIYPTNAGGGFRELHSCDPNRDPMVFPLLFPHGDPGK